MKYYKLINNNEFVGVANSSNFFIYVASRNRFLRSNEIQGEYIRYNGELYRSTWMTPTSSDIPQFITVTITEITEEEYDIFHTAIENNELIVLEPEEAIQQVDINPDQQISLEFLKEMKLHEISNACRSAIESGVDVNMHGELQHFSLTIQDQLNLMNLSAMAQTQNLIPYHADGEACEFYTAQEINDIVSQATAHKIYHTTYHNALKAYVNSLDTIENLSAVTYGMPVPDEYQTDVFKILE